MTRILVVEDERIIAKGIEQRLKSLGYAVEGLPSTGEEAILQAAERQPDMVLMDIHLDSGMDGTQAANLIRTRLGIPVVFLTAHSDEATLHRAKSSEPFGYILKPYEDKDLQIAIEIGIYRHRMDRRLRENEQWLAATLASIGDGVIAADDRGRVRFLNSLAEELTGCKQADAIGRDLEEVFRIVEERSRQTSPNLVLEALRKGESITIAESAILIAKLGEEYPIDASVAPIRNVNGAVVGAVLVFRDISERRRLEEHLRQTQKMEAVGRLAGGIAHDFNNIMTIITGFSELLLSRGHPPAVQEPLQHIHEAGRRAAGLTQQIMAFSRKQMLLPSVLNLNTIVRDMGVMVKRLLGSDIEFVTQPSPDVGEVKADPTQIGQVLLNLAANARDAMPRGGRLVVATANVDLGEEMAKQHPEATPGRYVALSISDTGHGMSDDVLPHIFEPFFTTKKIGHGTGLGLSTVYGIVKQSGGFIEVSSKVGEGTSFWVYLPMVNLPAPKPDNREMHVAVKRDETILLVEDEQLVREMTKMALKQSGYTVLEASNGLDGLLLAKEHPGPIHLLLTDLMMPKLSGQEMAERLKTIKPGLPVLFMSGYSEDVSAFQGAESCTVDFLQKPFTLDALARKVRQILDRNNPL